MAKTKKSKDKGKDEVDYGHITRDDLEAKFRGLQDSIQEQAEDKKSTVVTAAVIGGIVLLLAMYFLGKRSGKRKKTLVEIRRL